MVGVDEVGPTEELELELLVLEDMVDSGRTVAGELLCSVSFILSYMADENGKLRC